MSDAVLFFDECEALFRSRDFSGGSDRLLRAMLQEIERHAGLVFLATNRPAELDEAMHRRISTVVEFSPPSAEQRCAIWSNLVRKGRLRVILRRTCVPCVILRGGFKENCVSKGSRFSI